VTRPPSPRGGSWPSPGKGSDWRGARDDDGWGPATAVYSSTTASSAGPTPAGRSKRAFAPSADAPVAADKRTERSVRALTERHARPHAKPESAAASERGLKWWAALLVLIGIAVVGALIDSLLSIQGKDGFNIGIVVASIVAIVMVKRSHMFPVVIAPPIVYSAGALFQLYVRSSGLNDRRVVLDAAANYLVYGFPAIAAATAAVLIVAGFRLITRK
jgi:hypothetical protein